LGSLAGSEREVPHPQQDRDDRPGKYSQIASGCLANANLSGGQRALNRGTGIANCKLPSKKSEIRNPIFAMVSFAWVIVL
jgi:hypothetical protein